MYITGTHLGKLRFSRLMVGAELDVTAVMYGVIAMIIGILLLFFGIRLFRVVLAACCFAMGALFAFIIITNMRQGQSWGPNGDAIMLGICAVSGVVTALLGLYVWILALVAMGALCGFALSMYILTWKSGHVIDEHVARPFFITAATLVGGLVAIIYEKSIIALATCISGSVSLFSGLDVFADTGFNEMMHALIRNEASTPVNGSTYFLLGSCGIVAIIGMIIQLSLPKQNKQA